MDRVTVGAVAVSLLVISPLWLMFLEVDGNLLFVRPDARIAAAVDAVQQWLYLPIALTVAAVVATRWWTASRPGRRALLPSVAGSVYLLFFTVVLTAGLVGVPVPYAVYWILAFSVVVVPVAFLAGLLRSRLARGGLVELFRGMRAMRPADLRAALARALGDPALVIAYPVPGQRGFVDSEDRPVTLSVADGDRSVATVERDGQVVAALIYDRSLDDDPELVEAVNGAAAIALENQQLHVEAENRLAEVRASRQRVIAAGDAERRRIERNLHDGAQQRLVTLALQLSLIGRQIRHDPADAEQLVSSASGELTRSLEELRELACGIHPAALDQGLDIALDALALRSAVPTTVSYEPGPDLPEPVTFAAYFVASEALANVAKYARATAATVRLVRTETDAVIEITDDGVGGGPRGVEAVHQGPSTHPVWAARAPGHRSELRRPVRHAGRAGGDGGAACRYRRSAGVDAATRSRPVRAALLRRPAQRTGCVVTGGLGLALLAGALVGFAVALALATGRRHHPVLVDALAALDERRPTPLAAEAGRTSALLPLLRRLPAGVPDADLDLLGLGRDRFLIAAAGSAASLAAAGPVLTGLLAVLDTGLPVVVPAGFTAIGLLVGWTGHARRTRDRAEQARDQLRSALVAYLQQVSLLRRGGAGVSTALTLPARLLTDSWAMRRVRDELELAQRAGDMPWEGLRRFGERIDIDELADLSAITATAGQDGAAVVGTLLARAESLSDELLADEHADANRASGQMSTPGALQVFLIAAWVLFPAGTALLSTV